MVNKSLIFLFLSVITLAVYWQTGSHEFINYDDTDYVTANLHVQAGLTRDSLIWAFTSFDAGNWHPVTWISHMHDCQLFGLAPGGHHLTSLFLHLAGTLLLFILLNRLTGSLWRSAVVAALFAVHPLHVESVAWVAERKDVLSTLFWMLSLLAYTRYAERPVLSRYLVTLLFFILGLMSKPMLVTLPVVLLLLDYWPLGRLRIGPGSAEKKCASSPVTRLILEKLPFLALSIASCWVTILAQQTGTEFRLQNNTYWINLAHVPLSYVQYLLKMCWPTDLAVIYPLETGPVSFLPVAFAVAGLAVITVTVLRGRRRFPFLVTGWFWYLVTLLPVIGIVRVGAHSISDRYTYIPLVGIFILLAWGGREIAISCNARRSAILLALAVLLSCASLSWRQTGYWRNSGTLFEHALAVTDQNWIAHYNLGVYLFAQKQDYAAAAGHFLATIRINGAYPKAYNNLGTVYSRLGDHNKAVMAYREAIRLDNSYVLAHHNLGSSCFALGADPLGYEQYQILLTLDRKSAEKLRNAWPQKF
jgi:tetratricopeptide (TPR) repeat protein